MTIFDSIRYPISDRPTEGEINALPEELKFRLLELMKEGNLYIHSSDCAITLRIMTYQPINRGTAMDIIRKLRKMIEELP